MPVVHVMTAGVTLDGFESALLTIQPGASVDDAEVSFSLSARDVARMWRVSTPVAPKEALAATFVRALAPGAANAADLTVDGSAAGLPSHGGTIELHFGHGTMTGAVRDASPAELDATFSGAFGVSCLVPHFAFVAAGGKTGGYTIDGATGLDDGLVEDGEMITPACAPFRPLIH